MANSWFQFKQFKVHQQDVSMKVGTDGVLLGAWVGADDAKCILDIGTGTGLLALMMAQRNANALIDAIEIDDKAIFAATQNFDDSPWADRLTPISGSIQKFANITTLRYDLIVCNPPFFIHSLKSPDGQRNAARHNDLLSLSDLAQSVDQLLTDEGRLALILPVDESTAFELIMKSKGFLMNRKLNVKPTNNKPVKRILSQWVRYQTECEVSTLVVEPIERHCYSDDYIYLTKDFYLFL